MFESITMNFLTQPKVVAAVDIFRALQTAATSLKNNLMIFAAARSEEHTSELQSQPIISYAVICLKKKKKGRPTPCSIDM